MKNPFNGNIPANYKPKNLKTYKPTKGFTLVELIIVITVIAVLAAAVFVAIDPIRRINESRNARRWSDVTSMVDGVVKYLADTGSHHSEVSAITAGEFVIIGTTDDDDTLCNSEATAALACANGTGGGGTKDCVDLSQLGTKYFGSVPFDPQNGSAADTSYYISRSSANAITVGSCDEQAEGAGGGGSTPTIELTR